MRRALNFDDVSLVPRYSNLSSRSEVNLSVPKLGLDIPIISAPMDTVTGIEMQIAMTSYGGRGIHHRYTDLETLRKAANHGAVAISPSMQKKGLINIFSPKRKSNNLAVIDVAHGDMDSCLKLVEKCHDLDINVCSGNITTRYAAEKYLHLLVDILRVGIAQGDSCDTYLNTGVGVPQLTAIRNVRNASFNATIISDGGCKSSGDIVKALAAGADAVILGRLLAGADEALGEKREVGITMAGESMGFQKMFRGMASRSALEEAGKEVNVEGHEKWIDCTGPVANTLDELCNGIRAGLAYLGVRSIEELHHIPFDELFVRVK